MSKKPNRFDECVSFEEGRTLYREQLLLLHPDQGGDATALIECKREFDSWVSRKAWEAHQSGETFPGAGAHRHYTGNRQGAGTDPEDFLSDATKELLRDFIELGINCDIEIVGSFIWLSNVAPTDVLTAIAWDFTRSKKYGGRWFWADFDYMKQQGTLPRGKFTGNFEDMRAIHHTKKKQEKLYLGPTEDEQAKALFDEPNKHEDYIKEEMQRRKRR